MEGKLLEDYLDVTALLANLNKETGSERANKEALELMKEYKSVEEKNKVAPDGFDRILEGDLEEVRNRLEASSIS
ncbi:hypothetical protein NKR23_g1127 [Pleurostoma richardsiae]|uniref:Uncharacterized protein n=1 Tax=Pleurostoma richardsiae TaxID=41990 RepID=A0AA38SCW9_9PEZI|nr:hypothetical protein NKR23_g1127 [Pleurostoma richardsiae]